MPHAPSCQLHNTTIRTHSHQLQLTKCLALKLGPSGVRVVGVAPAAIITPSCVAQLLQSLMLPMLMF